VILTYEFTEIVLGGWGVFWFEIALNRWRTRFAVCGFPRWWHLLFLLKSIAVRDLSPLANL